MWKLSRNKNILLISAAFFLAALGRASAAGTITSITIPGLTSANYTAGVATNTPTTTIFIFTFAGSSSPSAGQVVTLELLDSNGDVITNGMSPTSFTTGSGSGNQTFNGGNSPFPITFFRSGSGLQLKATCGSVSGTSGAFNVATGAASKLILIGPGMSHAPGTNPDLTTGHSGSFTPQEPNQSFSVRVILTDAQFNKVSAADSISFTSGDLVTLPSAGSLTAGTGDFTFTITGARTTRTIVAHNGTNGAVADGSLEVTTAGPPTKEVFPFPSPFNPHERNITFRFRLSDPDSVKLIVMDLMGQKVWEREVSASIGFTDVTWDGRNNKGTVVAAGVYYVLLEVDGSIESKKRFGVVK